MSRIIDNFWDHVTVTESGCWEWAKGCFFDGYGRIWIAGKNRKAHRVAWGMTYGEIPARMCVLHRCDNPPCINPHHLFLGTQADNMSDCSAKGRQPDRRGERGPGAVLKWPAVREIRKLCAEGGESYSQIGARFSVGVATIHSIATHKSWREEGGTPLARGPRHGEKHHNTKLTSDAVSNIRALRNFGLQSLSTIAEKYGVRQSTVSRIANGKLWKPASTPITDMEMKEDSCV
jgi:transposase